VRPRQICYIEWKLRRFALLLAIAACGLRIGLADGPSETEKANTRLFSADCSEVLAAANGFLVEHGFEPQACVTCGFRARKSLRDPSGKRISDDGIISQYTLPMAPRSRVPFPFWRTHGAIETTAHVKLSPEPNGCKASLTHTYLRSGAVVLVVCALDDSQFYPSHSRLESEYLNGVADRLRH
jgi:hypothetical protein